MASTSQIEVEVESREVTGKNACRRLRAEKKVPGNVYGLGRPPFMVAVNPRRVDEVLKMGSGINTIFSLSLKGQEGKREAMIKEMQRDPVTENLVHIDFVRVDPTQRIQVKVPIRLLGLATGVKNEGGIVDFVHREIEVDCLPASIPEFVGVDISELHIGQHVSVKDLDVVEGLNIHEDGEQIVAVVVSPKAEEEPVAEDELAEGEGEPEVAAKGKEEGEGDAADKDSDKDKKDK